MITRRLIQECIVTNYCYFTNSRMSSVSRYKRKPNVTGGKSLEHSGKQPTLLSYFKKVETAQDESDSDRPIMSSNNNVSKNLSAGVGVSGEKDELEMQSRKRLKLSDQDDQKLQDQGRLMEKSKALSIVDVNMGLTWFQALEKEFDKSYFKSLNSFVTSSRSRGTVFPPSENVWEWTKHCSIRDIKVVILGQDPYHGTGQAHGLCFSVLNVSPPPSLLNMYKELKDDIPNFKIPNHGHLVGWASQGVLLLNAVLTVDAHQANSHKGHGWEELTDATICWISENLSSVVFLLWGAYAQKKAAIVDKKKHHLLQAVHPSPLSAHKGFFGCKHFSKCNALLQKGGKKPIDWSHLPQPSSK